MAAEHLEQAAKKLGYTMDVETHGSIGVEGTFSADDIRRADAVIVAADSRIDLDRFGGKRVVVAGVADGIHNAEDLIRRGLAAEPLPAPSSGEARPRAVQPRQGIYPILMNGVSHMIPFVVVGGLLLAVAFGIGGVPGPSGLVIPEGSVFETLKEVGVLGFTLMVPILSGFIAYAIADRPGLAPGMITGMLAVTPAIYHSESGAGFLGGIITGLLSGYVALAIKRIPVHKYVAPIWPIIVIPVTTTLAVGALFIYVLGAPIAAVFTGLTAWLAGMQGASAVLLGVVLGLMTGFDLGGPVNKVAYLFAGGLIAAGNFYPAGMNGVAVAVPPIGMALASFLSRRYFTDSERQNGLAALFMGFFGITEGAIPFAAARPLQVIPANMIGSAVGAGLAGFLTVECHVMWGGPIVAVVGAVGQPLLFILSLVVGSVTTALIALGLIAVTERRHVAKAQASGSADGRAVPSSPISPVDLEPVAGGRAAVATVTRPASVLDYISEETIVLDSAAGDRDALIAELVGLGVRTGQVDDPAVVLTSALARESLMSTAVGEGIAIPHAKSSGAARPMVAFAKARDLDWGSPSGDPARLVFLISVPEADAGDEHLRILAKLSRALARPAVRESLTEATTAGQVLQALRAAVD
jgi:PTS system fructose-specific IIC component